MKVCGVCAFSHNWKLVESRSFCTFDSIAPICVGTKHVSHAMESDLKRSDASRKSFRVPAKSRQAPSPPKSSVNNVVEAETVAAATTRYRLYNAMTMSPSQPSAVDKTAVAPVVATVAMGIQLKTFRPGGCVSGSDTNSRPLKLADILKPNECTVTNNYYTKKCTTNAVDTPKTSGVETSLDVLKDLEKRINRIEMNEKLKQTINGRKMMADGDGAMASKLFQIRNQYADRENLTKAGLDSSSTLSADLEQSTENENSFFRRNSDERSSIGGTIALKAIIDVKPSSGGAFSNTKPVLRTVSDAKSAENSAKKFRINYMQKTLGQQQLQKQKSLQVNNSTVAMIVSSREHITSFADTKSGPLSPLTCKKKENTFVVDKMKLTTGTIADGSRNANTSKLSHSSSLKRETLRHPIAPTATTATTVTTVTAAASATASPTERSVKLNKKHQQVIWIRSSVIRSIHNLSSVAVIKNYLQKN